MQRRSSARRALWQRFEWQLLSLFVLVLVALAVDRCASEWRQESYAAGFAKGVESRGDRVRWAICGDARRSFRCGITADGRIVEVPRP